MLSLDVANAQHVKDAAEKAGQELGPIDTWADGAMTTIFASSLKSHPKDSSALRKSPVWKKLRDDDGTAAVQLVNTASEDGVH